MPAGKVSSGCWPSERAGARVACVDGDGMKHERREIVRIQAASKASGMVRMLVMNKWRAVPCPCVPVAHPVLPPQTSCSPVTRSGALGRTRTNQCQVHNALPGPARGTPLVAGSGGEWLLLAAAATGRRTPTLASVQAVQEPESSQSVRQCTSDHATGAPQTPASTAHAQLTIGRHAAAIHPGWLNNRRPSHTAQISASCNCRAWNSGPASSTAIRSSRRALAW